MQLLDYDPDDIDVTISELLVATSDEADPLVDPRVGEVLSLLREKLKMDVVFVSQFANGRRTFRAVDQAPGKDLVPVGASDPLEESWCQRVVDGRLPQFIADAAPYMASGAAPPPAFPIGTHVSTPVVTRTGEVFGTLCCFSTQPVEGTSNADLDRLRYTANLLGTKLATPPR